MVGWTVYYWRRDSRISSSACSLSAHLVHGRIGGWNGIGRGDHVEKKSLLYEIVLEYGKTKVLDM